MRQPVNDALQLLTAPGAIGRVSRVGRGRGGSRTLLCEGQWIWCRSREVGGALGGILGTAATAVTAAA